MKTRLVAPRSVPEFVRAEYPAFVEFLKTYYQWFEDQYSMGAIEDLVDVDKTVDDFLVYFRKQVDIYGVTTPGLRYLKDVKQLYTRKGTPEGIQMLLGVMFNKSVEVRHPWDQTFKTSIGKWRQDISIQTRTTKGDPSTLIGNPIIVTDANGHQYKTYVNDVVVKNNQVTELFIVRIAPLDKLVRYASEDGTIGGVLYSTTTSCSVHTPGEGFRIGQVFNVSSGSGVGTLLKIKSVDKNGGIKACEIIAFGYGYQTDFNILITPTATLTAADLKSSIQIGGFTYGSDEVVNAQNETGAIIKHDYTNLGEAYVVDPTYVGTVVAEIKSQDAPLDPTINFATVQFKVGTMAVYPGYYESGENLIGDQIFVQDSKYYQAYSYVTHIEEAIKNYGGLLRAVMHPAGMKHFGNYRVYSDLQADTRASVSLNVFGKTGAQRDYVSVSEAIARVIQFFREFTDEAYVSDSATSTASYIRSFTTDSVSVAHGNIVSSFGRVIPVERAYATHNVPTFDATRGFQTQVVSVTETKTLTFNKYITDTVTVATSGAIYHESYVLQTPPYWEMGYLEGEYTISN